MHVSYTPCFISDDTWPSYIKVISGKGEVKEYSPEKTCRRMSFKEKYGEYEYFCSECDAEMSIMDDYCSGCGAKVVGESMKQENARTDCYFIYWLYEQGFAAYICRNKNIACGMGDLPCCDDCPGYFSNKAVSKLVYDAIETRKFENAIHDAITNA